jgi:hypothetical protein
MPATRELKSIKHLYLDNNAASRVFKLGFESSLKKISAQIENIAKRKIVDQTSLVLTPSSFFEYCGIPKNQFIQPTELQQICNIPDPGNSDEYFQIIYQLIKDRVNSLPELTSEYFISRLEQKLSRLPNDSQSVLKVRYIEPIRSNPSIIKKIREDVTFHLFCSIPFLNRYIQECHIHLVRLAIAHYKSGSITSVGKILPHIWNQMKTTERGKAIPHEERKFIDGLLGMHQVRDFIDSDLTHLSVTGVLCPNPENVICVTEDSPDEVKQRSMLYRILFKNMLEKFKKLDDRENSKEFKNISLHHGFIVCLEREGTLEVKDIVNVLRIKKVVIP